MDEGRQRERRNAGVNSGDMGAYIQEHMSETRAGRSPLALRDELYREAVGVVRATIEKAAHVSPEALDEALIQKTVKQIRTS